MLRQIISNGEITFSGSLDQLLQTVISLNGVLMDNCQFRCVLPYRKPQGGFHVSFFRLRGLSLFSFLFRCRYEATAEGFRIRYRVTPSLFCALLLFFPIFSAWEGFRQFSAQDAGWLGLLIGVVLAAVIWPLFLHIRRKCLTQFLDTLSC